MFTFAQRTGELKIKQKENKEEEERCERKNNAISHIKRKKHAKNMAFARKTTVMQIR